MPRDVPKDSGGRSGSGTRRSKDVDRLLAGLGPPQGDVARALREVVLKVGPELRETVKWGMPCYVRKRLVCSIAAQSDHTNLEFYHGASLRDPDHLLEGTGKNLRHVKFYKIADVQTARIAPLLQEALKLDAA